MMIPENAYVSTQKVFRKYTKVLSRSFTNSCDQIILMVMQMNFIKLLHTIRKEYITLVNFAVNTGDLWA